MQSILVKSIPVLALCVYAGAAAEHASAQVGNSGYVTNYILNRPTVSPYLNLIRRDGFGGVTNYQTLVRPQLEAREFARNQQAELSRVQQQLAVQQRSLDTVERPRAQRVFTTGHPTRFMNLQQYYPGFRELRR